MGYLHRFNKVASPTCPACHERAETVTHYLMHCPAYEHMRDLRDAAFPAAANSLSRLLTAEDAIPHLLRYVQDTQRFNVLALAETNTR